MFKALLLITTLLLSISAKTQDSARINALLRTADDFLFKADIIGQSDSAEIALSKAETLNRQARLAYVTDHIEVLRTYIKGDTSPDPAFYKSYLPIIALCHNRQDKANERLGWTLLADAIHAPNLDSLKLSAYEKARTLAQQLGDKQQELLHRVYIADVYLDSHKPATAKNLLHQAINDSRAYPGPLNNAYNQLATLYFEEGKMDSALFYALGSEKLKTATGDTTYITNVYNTLSSIYYVLKQPEEGIRWDKKALQHCISTGKMTIFIPIVNSIVAHLMQLGRLDEALALIDSEAVKIHTPSLEDKRLIEKMYGKIYLARKDYALAEKRFRQAIQYGHAEGAGYAAIPKGSDYRALGLIYYQTQKPALARQWFDSALQIWQPSGRQDFLQQIHQDLCLVDSALGNFPSALRHLRAANAIAAVIFNQERDKKVEELKIEYQTEEREKDLRLLQNQQQLANQQLLQTRTVRNGIFAASILLFLIAILLYRENRTRRKTNHTITHKNAQLEKLLGEKEWLLKEVHHRVKNNLHTIVSLLESQASYLDNEALEAVEASQNRVYAMSLVHQKLYRQDNLRTIDMDLYLREFIQYLSESFGSPPNIHITTTIEPIHLDLTSAISVGMITNEALTNAFKYAFPHAARGEINIQLVQKGERIDLRIADNGIGFKTDQTAELDTLGLELMKGFVKDLQGSIRIENSNGTIITVSFEENNPVA